MNLYHFTCVEHGVPGITASGMVVPNHQPVIGIALAWFTDLKDPDRDAIGLSSNHLHCDRMSYRFQVADAWHCRPWLGSLEQSKTHPWDQAWLHSYGKPEHWWISTLPVPVHSEIEERIQVRLDRRPDLALITPLEGVRRRGKN